VLRHSSDRVQDRTHLGAGRLQAVRCVHYKISARRFSASDICLAERLRACQYARALDLGRRRHHHDGIHPLVSPGLEQERDIEDRKLLAARLGLREKLLLGGLHQRDTDFDLSCQPWREDRQRPVGPGICHTPWWSAFTPARKR
jgi:hypothetical protein